MIRIIRLLAGLLVMASCLTWPAFAANGNAPQISIVEIPKTIQGHTILGHEFLSELYQKRGQGLIWNRQADRDALKTAIDESWKDGLQAQDFHLDVIDSRGQGLSASEYDIILSDALARLLYQTQNGKINPETLAQSWNYKRVLDVPGALDIVADHLANHDILGLVAAARPQNSAYAKMSTALQTYTLAAQQEDWTAIADGPAIKPGASDVRIAQIRARLKVETSLDADNTVYDETLKSAVQAFQEQNNLTVDGVIGAHTLAIMNVSPRSQAQRIRVNMERMKWVMKALNFNEDMVVVNIAGYELALFQDGAKTWTTRVVVGKPYTKTPIFTDNMEYLVINPTWTLPYSIIRKSVIPGLKKDPNYLTRKGYEIYDRSGALADPKDGYNAAMSGHFPYTVVQPPGPKNALGQIKFIFPNKYNVYLHDTPSRTLFNRDERAFSHGCIRVQDPLKLAQLVLRKQPGWDRAKIDATVASGALTQVPLDQHLKVAILYWTADPIGDKGIRFHTDVYDRDPAVLAALNAPLQ